MTNTEEGWEGKRWERNTLLGHKEPHQVTQSFGQACEPDISTHVMTPTDMSVGPQAEHPDKQTHTDIHSDIWSSSQKETKDTHLPPDTG